MLARYRNAKISYKKLLPIAKIIRKYDVKKALEMLKFIQNKGAALLYKTIKSAVSNAENNFGISIDKLRFDQVLCSNGYKLPRIMYRGRARVYRIYKNYSNIFIKLKPIDDYAQDINTKKNNDKLSDSKSDNDIKRIDIDNLNTDNTNVLHNDESLNKFKNTKDKNMLKVGSKGKFNTKSTKAMLKRTTNKGS